MPLIAFVMACVLALAFTPLSVRLAWAIGFLDHPEARKLHTAATALLGGVVVFASALAAWWIAIARLGLAASQSHDEVLALVSGAAIALVWGLWDDRFGMGVRLKLLGQVLAASCLILAGVVPDLGWPGPTEAVVTVFLVVALMNAVNFLDNMNGMIAGLTAVLMLGFAWGSLQRGAPGLAAAQFALAGACAGFLPFNFPRARTFLGDAGSLLLGYSLGASAMLAVAGLPPGWGRMGPLIMLLYPAFDLIFVVINRVREGRPVQQGGKDHSNHRLARLLKCPIRTVMLLWLVGAALCASALVAQRLNQAPATLLLSGAWLVIFLLTGLRLSSVPSQSPVPSAPSSAHPSRA
ncbi:MAG: undecaprenyl/decaprenyl-phosphate alpha-N-acetylglucosaminyl 1-phosphate transferase [Candidatus Eisenbacteria bacterium]|uniref:Undecaprenyl/decaprenyl-phosphate alpha-N-acetylglucosaminyl 1-phosphate transferase n=1 Tax=Eiseniibacteriota bacterium TaxID=2212470 RepID=A0A849SNS9_UNCEI|nr:undecaprenyl/decaprenyl-phosphate alpha-N-acetylglucosaminyl 1-phosphate transferase [Candidatus Eisenbacteria bacterium]